MSDQLQLRRDTLANIQAATPAQGELAFATDTDQLFIGDGVTPGGVLLAPSIPFFGYRSGRFYTSTTTSALSFAVIANTLYATPFLALTRVTFTKLSLYVTAGVAATNARIGMYTTSSSAAAPASLLAGSDTGSFSTAAAGLQEVTGLSITLSPGFYWIASMFSGTPTVMGCNGISILIPPLYGTTALNQTQNDLGYVASQTFGALPASFPAGGFTTTTNALPIVGARL
jgi:hypothetical protein